MNRLSKSDLETFQRWAQWLSTTSYVRLLMLSLRSRKATKTSHQDRR
jgi:hypothetical protein